MYLVKDRIVDILCTYKYYVYIIVYQIINIEVNCFLWVLCVVSFILINFETEFNKFISNLKNKQMSTYIT